MRFKATWVRAQIPGDGFFSRCQKAAQFPFLFNGLALAENPKNP